MKKKATTERTSAGKLVMKLIHTEEFISSIMKELPDEGM